MVSYLEAGKVSKTLVQYAKDSNSLKYVDKSDVSAMRASLGLSPNQNKNNNRTVHSSLELDRLRSENLSMNEKLQKMRVELTENSTRSVT